MNMPLISIVIPAYNVELWIAQCMQSIVQQSYQNFEVIVIDDGSTDRTLALIQEYAKLDSRIRFESQQNCGQSIARNRGIGMAKGEFLLFLDSDDWLHSETLERIVKVLTSHKIDLVVFRCAKYFEGSDELRGGTDEFYWQLIERTYSFPCQVNSIPEFLAIYPLPHMKAFTRQFILNNDLYFMEKVKHQDNVFHFDVFHKNPSVFLINQILLAWRVNRPGQTTSSAHISDTYAVLQEMINLAKQSDGFSEEYSLIPMVRLISSEARLISEANERLTFLLKTTKMISELISKNTNESLNNMIIDGLIHPGDFILIKGVLTSPHHLSSAFQESGLRSKLNQARLFLSSLRSKDFLMSFRIFVTLILSYKRILQFSAGTGAQEIEPF